MLPVCCVVISSSAALRRLCIRLKEIYIAHSAWLLCSTPLQQQPWNCSAAGAACHKASKERRWLCD